MILRRAEARDAPALAALHVAVWRATYRDLAPTAAQAALDLPHRLRQWTATLASPAGTMLAVSGGQVVGLVSHGAPTHPVFGAAGEVRHLYVAPDWQGRGVGRALLAQARQALAQAGFPATALAVVAGNAPARAFYRAMGGVEGARFRDPGPLWQSDNIVVSWPG